MKIRCKNCNRKINITDYNCPVCGTVNFATDGEVQTAYNKNKSRNAVISRSKRIIAVSLVAVIIVFTVWDFIDAPPFWHFRQVDKQAIIRYQREHYPGARFVKSNFPFLGNPGLVGVPVDSSMTFEYDGVEFVIAADNGEISADGYYEARAIAQFDKIIKDGFLKPRQITSAVPLYTFYDDYEKNYPYTGELGVELCIVGEGVIPQNIGWLYEFYKYWKKEGEFLRKYRAYLIIYETSSKEDSFILFENDTEFANENEFYSAFKKYEY